MVSIGCGRGEMREIYNWRSGFGLSCTALGDVIHLLSGVITCDHHLLYENKLARLGTLLLHPDSPR